MFLRREPSFSTLNYLGYVVFFEIWTYENQNSNCKVFELRNFFYYKENRPVILKGAWKVWVLL